MGALRVSNPCGEASREREEERRVGKAGGMWTREADMPDMELYDKL